MHVPNEGLRAHFLDDAKGIWPGVPDFILWLPKAPYGAFMVELKKPLELCTTERDHPTWQQWQLIAWFNTHGYLATVAYGSDEAIDFIESYIDVGDARDIRESLRVAPPNTTVLKSSKYGQII